MTHITPSAISAGWPRRRSGTRLTVSRKTASDMAAFVDSVSVNPGATPATRMPIGLSSRAQTTVSALTPAFAAEYADWPGLPVAETELILMTSPRVRVRIIPAHTDEVT